MHIHPPVSTSEWPDRWTRYWRECQKQREKLHPKSKKTAPTEEATFDWK